MRRSDRRTILQISLVLLCLLAVDLICLPSVSLAVKPEESISSQSAAYITAKDESEVDHQLNTGKSSNITVDSSDDAASEERVKNLANLEALLNIIANASFIIGLDFGSCLFCTGFILLIKDKSRPGWILMVLGAVLGISGMTIPGLFNWLVVSARDANLFS